MAINDNLLEDYRNVITNAILNNEILVDVLGKGEYDLDTADELLWKNVFPNDFAPETLTETDTYIFYDMDESVSPTVSKNGTGFLAINLYFWIVTHRDIIRYNGNIPSSKNRLRNDIVVRELKQMFAPERNLGVSKNKFLYNKIFAQTNNKYSGRLLAFQITDFADKIRYGIGKGEIEKWQ